MIEYRKQSLRELDMNTFFDLDNGFFVFLGKIFDVMVLSFIWMLLCIPIITIGPATTALYYASVKVLRGERGYLMKDFFHSFKLNFKSAAFIGVILTLAGLLIGFDIFTAITNKALSSKVNAVLFGTYIAMLFLLLSITIYIFPLLSRFEMKIKQLFKSSIYMAIRHLPLTVCMLIILVGSFYLFLNLPIAILVLPATVTLINSIFLERIFKKYIPNEESEGENVEQNSDTEDRNE